MNYDEMYQVIFDEPYVPEKFDHGIRSFDTLPRRSVNAVYGAGWINPEERTGRSPAMKEFLDFIAIHPLMQAHGYVTDKTQNNGRVVITGLSYHSYVTMRMLVDFVPKFKDADEFSAGVRKLWCNYHSDRIPSSADN